MSIRVKFRSSANYDAVDIDGRPSIPVWELRSKIIRHKNLNVCRDFDLVFSNAASGQEYDDENFLIPSGTSVIVKRVPAGSGCAQVQASEQPISRGAWNKGNVVDDQQAEEKIKLERLLNTNTADVQNASLPSELKCFLCNSFFKDAVMIPCCQHSFCNKCIRQVLVRKARCPKCFSDKCSVESLLPNLSLRQAIKHFLESQTLKSASENAFNKYAPDGESGIQGNDASCAVTVIQREPESPHSSTATGEGSNIVIPEPFYDLSTRRNACFGSSDCNTDNLAAGRKSVAPNLQKGEKLPIHFPRNSGFNEAASIRNRGTEPFVVSGGDRNFLATGRQFKGNRTCYMCGSPEHLIRDCPMSSGPHPMLQTGPAMLHSGIAGYASSYWNSAAYLSNSYSNPAMMPFNASLVPITIYGVPPFVPNLYGGLPTGGLGTGTLVPPLGKRAECPLVAHHDVGLQCAEKKRKLSSEHLGRGQNYDVEDDFLESDLYCEPDRSHEYRACKGREASGSYSGDSFARRSQKKNQFGQHGDSDTHSLDGFHQKSSRSSVSGREQKRGPSERSGPGLENSKERSKHHHKSLKRHREIGDSSCSDSSQEHHQSRKRARDRWRVDIDVGGSHENYGQYTESRRKPSSPGDKRRQLKDRDPGFEFGHPRHNTKHKDEHLYDYRQQMISGLDEDNGDDYHHRRRKRVH